LIERNKIGGNLNGIYIASPAGNVIRRNTIVGNPPVEVSHTFGDDIGKDIQDVSPVGTNNVFEENDCLTYAGTSDPPPCPSILGWHSWDSRNGYNESGMATTPFQGLFKRASIGRSRLSFPQARLVNAVFHPSGQHLPKAAASAYSGPSGDSDSLTITGKVVDAACYMLHAPAAIAASHKECSAACIARGVPLAIAADDGALYFPADGNQRLKGLLNARVRASGTVVEKHDPMELKMPVGDKNQMVVRVEGGYKQITIQTMEKLPPTKRQPA
jgi:parallel beta-helix repeat protein